MRMAISLRFSARSFFIPSHAILAKLNLPVIFWALALGAADPVSYSRHIAPMLAMRCHGCHGSTPAGGLDTRSYAGLMRGGSLGPAIIAGQPERSLLVDFIEGRRGESRRMPLAEPALSASEIALIRRWIAEGAREDEDKSPKYLLRLDGVPMPRGQRLEIRCKVPVRSYLRLAVNGERILHTEEVPVRRPEDAIIWSIGAGPGWPANVDLELTILYADREPSGAFLAAGGREASGVKILVPRVTPQNR